MEPNSFGVTRGEQPLVRASRASKVAGAFLVLFWHAKENIPGGDAFCKRHEARPTRILSVREADLLPRCQCNAQLRHIGGRYARDAPRLTEVLRPDAGQLLAGFQRQAGQVGM